MHWSLPLDGLWIVIDMFAGISSLLVALSIVGVQHIAVVAEQDPELRRAIVHAFPTAVVIDPS